MYLNPPGTKKFRNLNQRGKTRLAGSSRQIQELDTIRTATMHNLFSALQIIKPEKRRIRNFADLNREGRDSPGQNVRI